MTHDKLINAITSMDQKMRTKARMMCGGSKLGDDIWHDAVLKLLTTYKDREIHDKNMNGLIYSVMVTSLMDYKRKNGFSDRCVELKFAEEEIINHDYSIYAKLTIGEILDYLDTIQEKHRNIFLMSVFGMDNDSISEEMRESKENVRKIIQRVRAKIKINFKNEKYQQEIDSSKEN
jgi:RNA polymerase sigma factor (sigma-70 family)